MASSEVIEIGAEPTPIAAALGRFLDQELSVYGHAPSVSLDAAWQGLLAGAVSVVTPILLVPRRPIDLGTDLDGSDPDSFVCKVQDAVTRWRTVEDPVIDAGAAVVFKVTLYPADEPAAHAVMLRYTVEIGAEPTPIAAALGRFLDQELSVYDHAPSVSLDAAWQGLLAGAVSVVTPILLVPRRPIDLGTDLDGSDPDSFVRKVQDAVTRWRTVEDPVIDAGAAVVFKVTLYPADEPAANSVMLRYTVTPS